MQLKSRIKKFHSIKNISIILKEIILMKPIVN